MSIKASIHSLGISKHLSLYYNPFKNNFSNQYSPLIAYRI